MISSKVILCWRYVQEARLMTAEKVDKLEELSTCFRDLINLPRRHYNLSHGTNSFYQLCSAMDIIGDICLALRSYLENDHDDQGLAYLEIFGVLNSLNIQQDAVRRLYKIILASEIDLEQEYPRIREIRKARIHVAGHPVTGDGASHFLVRFTLTRVGFEYQSFKNGGEFINSIVNLYELIEYHIDVLCEVTEKLIQHMEKEDREHKEQFRNDSLTKIFKGQSYCSSKLFEGLEDRSDIAGIGIKCIHEILNKFKNALENRSEHFTDSDFLTYDMAKLEYAISKYHKYLNNDPFINKDDAYIFARFIQMELDSMEEIAQEIDEEYTIIVD